MYLRVISFHLRPEIHHTEVMAIYGDFVSLLDGYQGLYGSACGLNKASGHAVSFLLWEDESRAAEAGKDLLPQLFECLQHAAGSPIEINGYEVLDLRLRDSFRQTLVDPFLGLPQPDSQDGPVTVV